ncbi:MAG TPA: phospholipase [Actinoplanes sp.]|nr:phospholipase [Actinoplanes sp.]
MPSSAVPHRGLQALLALTATLAVILGATTPARAATAAGKAAVLASFTQTSAASYASWNAARQDQDDWSSYDFDWGTDYCSASPDRPLGFDFRLSCHRHDFGYRNHKATGAFTSAAKDRIDDAFHADLKRECATYSPAVRPACRSLAWTYYQAVSIFGSAAAVTGSDLDRAADLIV